MVSLLQEELITRPAFTVAFLLNPGRCLNQLDRSIQNIAQNVFMLLTWKALNSFYTMPKF